MSTNDILLFLDLVWIPLIAMIIVENLLYSTLD